MSENICQELEGALVAVADASASADEAAEVKAHVADCATCRDSLAEMRALLGSVRAADPASEKSDRFWKQLEADTLARVRAEALPGPSLEDARKKRNRRVGWIAGGFALAAAAAAALVFGLPRLRSHPAPAAPVAQADDGAPREDLSFASDDESDDEGVVDGLEENLGEPALASLAENLDGEAPELADLGQSGDLEGEGDSAGWTQAEGAPAEHMLDDLTPDQLSKVYDELSNDGTNTGG
jgi:hypothetical protein